MSPTTMTGQSLRELIEEHYDSGWDVAVRKIVDSVPALDEIDVEVWDQKGIVPQKFQPVIETLLGVVHGEIDWYSFAKQVDETDDSSQGGDDLNAWSEFENEDEDPKEEEPEMIAEEEEDVTEESEPMESTNEDDVVEEETMPDEEMVADVSDEPETESDMEEDSSPTPLLVNVDMMQDLEKIVNMTTSFIDAPAPVRSVLKILSNTAEEEERTAKIIYNLISTRAMSDYFAIAKFTTDNRADSDITLGVWIGQQGRSMLNNISQLVGAVYSQQGQEYTMPEGVAFEHQLAYAFKNLDESGYELIASLADLFTASEVIN